MVIRTSSLNRKLLRDLWHMKGQAGAIVLVIASGVGTFVMALATLDSLDATQRMFYENNRFAEVFASCKRAPNYVARQIVNIPGVSKAQTRIVLDVTLDIPEMPEPAVGRLISVPEHGQPGLNRLHMRRGRWIKPGGDGEAMVSEHFAEIHGLVPGDQVTAIINGRLQKLHIVGIVLSPEYVLQMRGGELLPDPKRFGVFWMSRRQLEAAYDMEGAFNDVTVTLMHGASEPEVIRRLDQVTEPYGGVGAFGRADQLSHNFLSEEIRALRNIGLTAPVVFLGVAVFLLNLVLARLIRTQREQIAALKAFGYSRREIGVHYLKLICLIVGIGVIVGVLLGVWMGAGLTRLYTQFYRFPSFRFELPLNVVVSAIGLTGVAAVVGTLIEVRRAVLLPPAEAMRPEPPASFKPTVFERLGLQRFLSPVARMILRKLEREPIKAALSCLGLSMTVAILVLGNFMSDAMDEIMVTQFEVAQRHDAMVTFVEPSGVQAFYDARHLPGVTDAEPFRAVAARLRNGPRHKRVGIQGLRRDTQLNRLIDTDGQVVSPPPEGLLLSNILAQRLNAKPGDMLTIEVLEGERPTRQLPITALIDDFAGANAYMDIDALHRMMREGPTVSGAYLAADPQQTDAFYHQLKRTPGIASVALTDVMVESFDENIAENQTRMQMFIVGFAAVIAFGVVYNTARISLNERSRELATMRVIGFTRAEVSIVLLGELAVLTVIAIPIGMVLGYGFAAAATMGFETELYRIPLVVHRTTFAFAAMVTVAAALLSGLVVRRRVDHLDLVAVLKTRE